LAPPCPGPPCAPGWPSSPGTALRSNRAGPLSGRAGPGCEGAVGGARSWRA
jgi:hypothetical protein